MKKVKVNFENCFWIKKLKNHEFDFSDSNVNLIYAKNWSMKTSFAKIFEKFQLGKKSEIKDLIHSKQPVIKTINIVDESSNEQEINKEEIFVIKSFIPSYESEEISTLLLNDELKEKISNVLDLKIDLLTKLEKQSGIKIFGKSGVKIEYKLEPQILKDFNIDDKSFLKKISIFWNDSISDEYKDIKYSEVFEAIDIIKSDDFQNNIKDFLEKSDEIYSDYSFLEKGKFTLAKLKKIQGELKKQSFFVNSNKIKFWDDDISENDLKKRIKEIEEKLQDTDEFKALEKLLQKPKWIPLKDVIENNPLIIEKLKLGNLKEFRKEMWQCYLKENEELFNELKIKFSILESEISSLDIDNTAWKEAIILFNERFFLPFRMDISNLESSMMGESVPKVIFRFPKDGNFENSDENNWEELDRKNLEEKDFLSQWEKRALYLLNIIFEIEVRKKAKQKILFIIDDVADSFDYKNKYAIVEYLRDLSQEECFYSIILTHNFDFFRIVQERILNNKWDNSFIVQKTDNEMKLEMAGSKNIVNPFAEWKKNLNNDFKALIPSIPFIRNLIEFKDGNKWEEYLTLTYVLHQKNEEKTDDSGKVLSKKTEDISICDLEKIFKESIKNIDFRFSEKEKNKKVIDVIFEEAKSILGDCDIDSISVGNKIILSIASRLKAEKFMWEKVQNKDKINGAQTGKLFQRYKDEYIDTVSEKINIKILESVNIMTPENIHLNSFMYEPILDMDIVELKNLYKKVKDLNV